MSHLSHTADYVKNSFPFPTLTKIHGYPTFVSLLKLKNQLKTNAKSVSSDLGGGALGHLGLVLTPEEYALVSVTPFIFPNRALFFRIDRHPPQRRQRPFRPRRASRAQGQPRARPCGMGRLAHN